MRKLFQAFFDTSKLKAELERVKQHSKALQAEVDALIKNSDGYIQPHLYSYEKRLSNPEDSRWPHHLISDYFRFLDTERYPVYAPLVLYLQRIGAVGSAAEIWTLPNGARVSIKPSIRSNFPFRMSLLTEPAEYRLREGWNHLGWWSKEHGVGHISQAQVAEVVRVIDTYLKAQRGVR